MLVVIMNGARIKQERNALAANILKLLLEKTAVLETGIREIRRMACEKGI